MKFGCNIRPKLDQYGAYLARSYPPLALIASKVRRFAFFARRRSGAGKQLVEVAFRMGFDVGNGSPDLNM